MSILSVNMDVKFTSTVKGSVKVSSVCLVIGIDSLSFDDAVLVIVLECVVFLKSSHFATEWSVSVEAQVIGTCGVTVVFSFLCFEDYLSLGSMATSHDDSISINRAIWRISCRNIHVSMAGVTFYSEHDILLGPEDKVAVALLSEWIDHDLRWDTLRQIVIFVLSLRSNVISSLLNNVENDIDVALNTPIVIQLAELESNTVLNHMCGWFFLNDVKVAIKGDECLQFEVLLLVVDDDLDILG